jgi:hypothetical protein
VPNNSTDAVIGGIGSPGGVLTADQTVNTRSLTLGAGYTLKAFPQSVQLYGDSHIDGAVEASQFISHTPVAGQTLDGSGTVTLSSSGWTNDGQGVFTIGSGLTVSGPVGLTFGNPLSPGFVNRGTITSGGWLTINAPFRNEGTIRTAADQPMFVSSRLLPWQNAGTIELGGRLDLNATITAADVGRFVRGPKSEVRFGGTLQNTGTTFQLDTSTGDWTSWGGTFIGGTIRTADGAHLRVDGIALTDVTLDTGVGGLTFAATPSSIDVTNALTLKDAVLDFSGTSFGPSPSVKLGGSAPALLGSGEVRLGTAFTSIDRSFFSTGTVTIGPGVMIHGRNGYLMPSGAPTLLQGTLAADEAGGTLFVGGEVTNTGSLKALNGGTLWLLAPWHNNGTIEVDGRSTLLMGGVIRPGDLGTINRAPGGVLRLTGWFSLDGGSFALDSTTGDWEARGGRIAIGTFDAVGGARLVVDSVEFDAVMLRASPVMRGTGTAGASVTVLRDLTLDGADIALAGAGGTPGTLTFSGTNSAQALVGNGSVTFGGNVNNALTNSSGRALTIGAGVLVHGQNGQGRGGAGGIANYGTIRADVAGGTLNLVGVTNHGAIELAGGRVRADGDLTQSASGVMRVALGSAAAGPLVVAGTVALDGTLEVVADGFAAAPLGSYPVLSYAGRVGRFAAYAGLDVAGPLALAPVYSATELRLVATLPGDANLDGVVNFGDLLALAKHYNARGDGVEWAAGDFTYDGVVNFADLLVLAKNYNRPLPADVPGAGGGFEAALAEVSAVVPEPGLVGFTLITMSYCGRRRRRAV